MSKNCKNPVKNEHKAENSEEAIFNSGLLWQVPYERTILDSKLFLNQLVQIAVVIIIQFGDKGIIFDILRVYQKFPAFVISKGEFNFH